MLPPVLLKAAEQFESVDVKAARETYLEAFAAALLTGRMSIAVGVREVAAAVRAPPSPPSPVGAPALLLEGLAV